MTADLRALLDRLDALVTPDDVLPWVVAVREDDGDEAVVLDGRLLEVTEVGPADAALIVAAVNALPGLLAAVRAAADLADEWGAPADARYSQNRIAKETAARALRDVLAAALTDGAAR